jgi:transposase
MDVSLDGSTGGYAGRIEVLEGRSGRRFGSEAERARIAAESMMPGAKVADVARRHAVTRWQVYDWRKKLMAGALALPAETADAPMFAALVVEAKPAGPTPSPKRSGGAVRSGRIEMVVDGVTLRVASDIDEAHLTRMIRAIRAASR